jgi:multimeric flavodoxin WrbA
MKTLIFNGSPRKDGNTSYLVDLLSSLLNDDVEIIPAFKVKVQPCMDCRYCWEHGTCVFHDDMDKIYASIKESDNIVIASPVNYGELTGKLLCVLSRLQAFYASKRFRNVNQVRQPKKGALILCGGGDGGGKAAERTTKMLLRDMNAKLNHMVTSLNTDTIPSKSDRDAIEQIKKLAEFFNARP